MKTEKRRKALLAQARTLPRQSGCYLMKQADGKILYVGKAKDLRARVVSYFNQSSKTPKNEILVGKTEYFDFQLTETEAEAFILENNLIKKHTPKYNILMRDDRSYPYVVIHKGESFPRLEYVRRVKRTKDKLVFGPFVVGSNITEVLRILTKSFTLRDCSLREFNSRKEPCLLYQMYQCSAPCVGKISQEEYERDFQLAINFFQGQEERSLKVLRRRMEECAEREEFERTIILRDNIAALEEFVESSQQRNAELKDQRDVDVVAFYLGEVEVDIALYMVRNGVLLGHKNFHFLTVDSREDVEEEILAYLYQYYTGTYDTLPQLIIAPFDEEKRHFFTQVFQWAQGPKAHELKKIQIRPPGQNYKSLLELTKHQAHEHQRVRLSTQTSVYLALDKLKELLGLPERPVVLECYDVAIWQGRSPTAAQVVFREGVANKRSYRSYHLKTRQEGQNDFAMMKEVLTRRLKKGDLPDVFVVDGGKGQVSAFQAVLREKGLVVPVVGLAKSKVKKGGHFEFKKEQVERSGERLIIPGRMNPYLLTKNRALFCLLTNMRDEAHRFSRKLHHKGERKAQLGSWVDDIPGIGPKMKIQILSRQNQTLQELAEMDEEELGEALGTSLAMGKKIKDYLAKWSIN